jgi:hypothetical protein
MKLEEYPRSQQKRFLLDLINYKKQLPKDLSLPDILSVYYVCTNEKNRHIFERRLFKEDIPFLSMNIICSTCNKNMYINDGGSIEYINKNVKNLIGIEEFLYLKDIEGSEEII